MTTETCGIPHLITGRSRLKRRGSSRNDRKCPMIQLKRVYEKPGPHDGVRFLIERLWPRGVRKTESIWMPGKRRPVRALSCGSGFLTIPINGWSFSTNISLSSKSGRRPGSRFWKLPNAAR